MVKEQLEKHPINNVIWIPLSKVKANDYNPNSVPPKEMHLLYVSIKEDGYTQPVVTIYDDKNDEYVIIDGFHRYSIMKRYKDIYDSTGGMLPVVVLKKNIAQRMASTVRHNRARGSHSVSGMSSLVFNMLKEGKKDEDICNELGMDAEELLKLKHLTGFSKLFKKCEYSKSWETIEQIKNKDNI